MQINSFISLGLQLYFDFQNFGVGLPVSPYRMQFYV